MEKAKSLMPEVSIHVPLAEHDQRSRSRKQQNKVSIHVPLAEHDYRDEFLKANVTSFNSRAPRGARQHLLVYKY